MLSDAKMEVLTPLQKNTFLRFSLISIYAQNDLSERSCFFSCIGVSEITAMPVLSTFIFKHRILCKPVAKY